jgi:hypothetical protein
VSELGGDLGRAQARKSIRRETENGSSGAGVGTSLFGCTFILYRYSCSHNVTLHQTSALSPLPSFPPVDLVLGTTFSEKSTCFVPWWMLDELITSMSSQT